MKKSNQEMGNETIEKKENKNREIVINELVDRSKISQCQNLAYTFIKQKMIQVRMN